MDPLLKEVGRNIRHYRLAAGMTQKALAEQSGVTVRTLSRIETGHTIPGLDLLGRLARTLEVGVWQLVDEQRRIATEVENLRASSSMSNLPAPAREAIARLIASLEITGN